LSPLFDEVNTRFICIGFAKPQDMGVARNIFGNRAQMKGVGVLFWFQDKIAKDIDGAR